ncbi:MAG TPA: hypothetical protein PK684_09230 [Bacillota bacterium]|nr:hypothetical protein [Bacillota bacterium]
MNYLLLAFGICLVIVAVVLFILETKKSRNEIRELEMANAQTEALIEELNELSSIIMDEMDKRYNNMLDIYKELLAVSETEVKEPKDEVEKNTNPGKDGQRDKKNQILDLHRSGRSPSEIAESLGIGVGEVELVLRFAGQGVESIGKTV